MKVIGTNVRKVNQQFIFFTFVFRIDQPQCCNFIYWLEFAECNLSRMYNVVILKQMYLKMIF